MTTRPFVLTFSRIAVASALVGGIAGLLHPDDTVAGGVFSPAWVPVHLAQTLAFGGSAFGALAFGLAREGRLARVAAIQATVGAGLASGAAMIEATAAAPLMRTLPEPVPLMALVGPDSPFPVLAGTMSVAILAYLVGFVTLGVAGWRAEARLAGALLVVGTVLELAPLPGIGHGLTILAHNLGVAGLALPLMGLASRGPAPLGATA